MDFKYVYLRKQYALLHPLVKKVVMDLDVWMTREDMPPLVLVHIFRTAMESEAFYWKSTMDTLKCSEEMAREIARKKFSWHKCYCAVDIRNHTFSDLQKQRIFKQLKTGHPSDKWEILNHNVGQGEHFHVGYKDDEWKHRWSNQLKG